MITLPIVDRELRVAARDRSTLVWRLVVAVSAVAVCGAVALVSAASRGILTAKLGTIIFGVLTWIAFIFASAAGIFLTADCLSEEKREGTLGLLFLTDLRGHDVALGKLLATSLRAGFSLLAMFPVMALAFVLGGVPASEFRHTVLAICNSLFFSLTLGLLISAVSREPHRAMNATLLLIVLFMMMPPGLGSWKSWLSPAYSFLQAGAVRPRDFWLSAFLVQLEGWCFLAAASWLAPKTWQEKARAGPARAKMRFVWLNSRRECSRMRWLERNPVGWLVSQDRWAASFAAMAASVSLGLIVLSLFLYRPNPAIPATTTAAPALAGTNLAASTSTTNLTVYSISGSSTTVFAGSRTTAVTSTVYFMAANICSSALSMLLELWVAFQVSRFYVEGKKSGFLELLLVTPLAPAEVVRGHWLGLRRLFLWPVLALMLLQLGAGAMQMLAMSSMFAGGGGSAAWGMQSTVQILSLILGTVSWVTGIIAIASFAMWMGAISKKIMPAVLQTLLYVKIIPFFGAYFVMGLSAFGLIGMMGSSGMWIMVAVPSVLIIATNIVLIGVAQRRMRNGLHGFLHRSERAFATHVPRPVFHSITPPPIPR